MDSGQTGMLIALIVLLTMAGLFSAAETAYSASNKIRLMNMSQSGNKGALKVLKDLENFEKILSTVIVGNNILNILASSLATVFFTSVLTREDLAVPVSTIVLTLITIIFSENTPKALAKENPEPVAIALRPYIKLFQVILFPVNLIFSGWKFLLNKIFKFKKPSMIKDGELITLVETAENEGEIEKHESQLIKSAIEFEDLDIGDVMVPRINVIAVDIKADLDSVYKKFVENGFSRMPVYSESIDTIIGVIHEKDFYALLHDKKTDLKAIIQPSICVSPSMKISTVLRMLQKAKIHMAIVVDEFGGTEGIVTLEDILEELVGEIYDEHDEIEVLFRKTGENTYLVSGDENIDEMLEKLDVNLHREIESTTVSGFVTELMDKIPSVGESFKVENLEIVIVKANTKHVQEIKVTVLPDESEEEKDKEKDKDKDKGKEEHYKEGAEEQREEDL